MYTRMLFLFIFIDISGEMGLCFFTFRKYRCYFIDESYKSPIGIAEIFKNIRVNNERGRRNWIEKFQGGYEIIVYIFNGID